jgi:hypothetical protein
MEGMPNNQQLGNKLTPQQQYMMAQKQAYMQRMRQQYMYQQRMMMQQRMAQQKQGFVKQTMQSPQQVANQMNNKGINPMQNANMGSVNQPVNNSPEYNFYKFNQQANQNDFANKSQVKIQWKFDEGAKQNIPTPQTQQPVQAPQQPQNFQPVQQPQIQAQMQQQREEPEAQVEMKSEVDEYGLTESQIESEGQIVDLDSMSLEDLKKLRKKVQRERDEALAKLNLILARDPNLNPVRLEDFPYYATLKKIQKGV